MSKFTVEHCKELNMQSAGSAGDERVHFFYFSHRRGSVKQTSVK